MSDEITESAVEPDHGKEESESAEEGGESGEETLLDEGIVDLLGEGGEVKGDGLVDLSDGILDEGNQCGGTLVGADFEIYILLVLGDLGCGEKRLGNGFFAERFVLRIFREAYDLNKRGRFARAFVATEILSDRICSRENLRARVSFTMATEAEVFVSVVAKLRPSSSGVRSVGKYPGETKLR